MSDVTRILCQIEEGDQNAAELLLPLVYDELRRLAAYRLRNEKPGQTLQATALVHEAYARLVGQDSSKDWDGKSHFFAAAANCMRRILVEQARRRRAQKRGGQWIRRDVPIDHLSGKDNDGDILALDSALDELRQVDSQAARMVELRYFAGFSGREAAKVLGVPPRTGDRIWAFARSWLFDALREK